MHHLKPNVYINKGRQIRNGRAIGKFTKIELYKDNENRNCGSSYAKKR